MSHASEHSDSKFYYLKRKKKGAYMIKCLLTELGWSRQENIWHSVMVHRPCCARSVCCARSISHDLRPNIFLSGPPSQSISTLKCPFAHWLNFNITCDEEYRQIKVMKCPLNYNPQEVGNSNQILP